MKLKFIIGLFVASWQCGQAFIGPNFRCGNDNLIISSRDATKGLCFTKLYSMESSEEGQRRSRLDGNTREPSAQELEIMDQMIEKLADAKPYELPNAVRRAFRVVSSPRFFMRIAELADKGDDTQKEKLSALASNLSATLEAVVETVEEQLDERAKEVEQVVKAAAEPDSGEFLVPLSQERVDAMREVINGLEEASMDEGFLSTVDAWMNKSHEDGMDGMVGILQKVLQMYAGNQISRARSRETSDSEGSEVAELFDQLLQKDPESWDQEIKQGLASISGESLIAEVQGTMEKVVLGLENGSMAQQVQAEFLRELVQRIESSEKS